MRVCSFVLEIRQIANKFSSDGSVEGSIVNANVYAALSNPYRSKNVASYLTAKRRERYRLSVDNISEDCTGCRSLGVQVRNSRMEVRNCRMDTVQNGSRRSSDGGMLSIILWLG